MNFTDRIMPIPTAFTQKVDEELIILDTQSENYFALDAIGAVMWEQLSKEHSTQKLYTYMLTHYEVEETMLKQDIKTFIHTLLKHKLLIGEA